MLDTSGSPRRLCQVPLLNEIRHLLAASLATPVPPSHPPYLPQLLAITNLFLLLILALTFNLFYLFNKSLSLVTLRFLLTFHSSLPGPNHSLAYPPSRKFPHSCVSHSPGSPVLDASSSLMHSGLFWHPLYRLLPEGNSQYNRFLEKPCHLKSTRKECQIP